MNRRDFLISGSIGSTALFSSMYKPGISQEEKIKVGLIGCGWYGMVITKAAFKVGGIEVLAICDVDTAHLEQSAGEIEKMQGNRPETYPSYFDLLDHNGLEAVFIASPPHWHALQFTAACEKGLHIYCEKPLAYDVMEGLAMVEAAQKAGNIVQVGFQRRQSAAFRKTREMIGDGMAGKIYQIEAQIHYNPILKDTTIQSPPPSLDWDAWCGPAPKLPYSPNIGHIAWRLEKEYGNGHLVDWGIHHIDIIRHIMNLGTPDHIQSAGGIKVLHEKITTPDTLTSRMNFGGIPVTWKHRLWGSGDLNTEYNNGIFFYGDKATIFAADRRIVIMPAGKDQKKQQFDFPAQDMGSDHMVDFLDAVRNKDRSMISCRIADAFKSTTSVQLAMISYYTGSAVQWDAEKNIISNNLEATKLLARDYRDNYERPV